MTHELSIIAFDPGETTGYCVMETNSATFERGDWALGEIDCRPIPSSADADKIVHEHLGLNTVGENLGVTSMLDLIDGYWAEHKNPVVVIEDFIVDFNQITKDRSALSPVRLIAALQFGMHWEQINAKLLIQNRTDPKRICTDARLRNWGLYRDDSGAHARDATRHAYHLLRRFRGEDIAAQEWRWRAWPNIFIDPHAETRNTPKKVRPKGERIHFN